MLFVLKAKKTSIFCQTRNL